MFCFRFIFSAFVALALFSCAGGDKGDYLAEAAAVADSIAMSEAGGSATVVAPDITLCLAVDDAGIPLSLLRESLFNVFVSQQLKGLPASDVAMVCDALKASGGNLNVVLNSPTGDSVSFALSAHQIVRLQRAKLSEFNLGDARNDVVVMAEQMVPGGEAHRGAVRVDVSVSKGFLEYNVVWSNVGSYSGYPQGILTQRYLNALRQDYADLGGLGLPVVKLLSALGIDGVRMVYSAENSDKTLKQAFPWREIRMPVEN